MPDRVITPPSAVTNEPITAEKALSLAIECAYSDQIFHTLDYLDKGADINGWDEKTGLSLLHISVGRNNLELAKRLLERGAAVVPDKHGRWPSTIAALCEVDGEMCDLIADAEFALGDV